MPSTMNHTQYYTVVLLSVVSLALAIVVTYYSQSNQRLQSVVQNDQSTIDRASTLNHFATNILQDIGAASLRDEKMKTLLNKNGYTVTVNKPGTDRPAGPAVLSIAR